jgi:hypothetical protein
MKESGSWKESGRHKVLLALSHPRLLRELLDHFTPAQVAGPRAQKQATTPACYGTIRAIKGLLRDTGNKLSLARIAWSSLR